MPVALCVASNPPETMVHVVDGCKATAAKFFFWNWTVCLLLSTRMFLGQTPLAWKGLLPSWRRSPGLVLVLETEASCSAHSVLCLKDLVS